MTEQAVKRWQAKHGVVSSGSSETTGYGVVGPKTRVRIREVCGGASVVPSVAVTPPTVTVDLKIDGSDRKQYGVAGYTIFSWTSANADYCTASGDITHWSGNKPTNGSETVWTTDKSTGQATYSITCGASSGKINPSSDSVNVWFSGFPGCPMCD